MLHLLATTVGIVGATAINFLYLKKFLHNLYLSKTQIIKIKLYVLTH